MHFDKFALALGIKAQDECLMAGKDRGLRSKAAKAVPALRMIEQLAHRLNCAGTAVEVAHFRLSHPVFFRFAARGDGRAYHARLVKRHR